MVQKSIDIFWRGLEMVIIIPNLSTRWQIEEEGLMLFTKFKWMASFILMLPPPEMRLSIYENLYHEDQPSRFFLDGIAFASINPKDASDLVKDFTEDEVWNAISELGLSLIHI